MNGSKEQNHDNWHLCWRIMTIKWYLACYVHYLVRTAAGCFHFRPLPVRHSNLYENNINNNNKKKKKPKNSQIVINKGVSKVDE